VEQAFQNPAEEPLRGHESIFLAVAVEPREGNGRFLAAPSKMKRGAFLMEQGGGERAKKN